MIATALAFLCGALAGLGLAGLLLPQGWRSGAGRRAVVLLAAAGRRVAPSTPLDLAARVTAAGRPANLGPRELMAAKVAAVAPAGVLGLLMSTAAPGRLGFLLVVVTPIAGFLAPDLWLWRRAQERARRVRRELPTVLDLLRVTVDSGASLPAAIAEVGARARGPLAHELQAVTRQLAVGVSLPAALSALGTRLPQPEVAALVQALDRARRHGAPPGETLAAQAREARCALQRRVREDAARAGPKIQLVVALLLVPSVLLLVAAALTAALLEPGGGSPIPV